MEERNCPGGSMHEGKLTLNTNSKSVSRNSSSQNAVDVLFTCGTDLKQPIVEDPTSKEIADQAQQLIEGLNKKRQNDSLLLEEYKHALETHTNTMVELLQEKLLNMHESQNEEVNKKLQQLFSCLDNITASQNDLDEFKESLRALYEDMQAK